MNACRNLGVLNQRVSDAVNVRKELDLRIGILYLEFSTMHVVHLMVIYL